MREGATNLKRALEAHGIEVERQSFDDSTPAAIFHSGGDVAVRLGEQPLVFNATGGHKLMTLALAENLPMADALHLLYVETRHDRLDWLKPQVAVEPMDDLLSLEDLLMVQGYRIKSGERRDGQWMQQASERESLTRRLGDEAVTLSGMFGALNGLADEALANEPRGPFRPQQYLEFQPGGPGARMLRSAQGLGLLHWEGGTQIAFAGEDAARYFRGGWLEEYVWTKLRGLKPKDFDINVQIESVQGKIPNEFDALVVNRNRLLVVECKTSRFGRDASKDADYIYKLAQLSRSVGGIMSTSLLLSARQIGAELRQRAKEHNIDVLAAAEVKDLAQYLRAWMSPSQPSPSHKLARPARRARRR
jgi:hypothetical protein